MSTFQDLLQSLRDSTQHQQVRIQLIQGIQEMTECPLIVYAADFGKSHPAVPNSINSADKTGFSDLIEGLEGDALDVLIHSPGGAANATEQIVGMLRDNFASVRFIVPHAAKSAATLMVLAGDAVLMDDRSELGPTDPQIAKPTFGGTVFVPAQAVLDGLEIAKSLVEREGEKVLPLLVPLLHQYDLSILQVCQEAIGLAKDLAYRWLVTYMLKDLDDREERSRNIADALSDRTRFLSHAKPIRIQEAIELGLKVEDMRDTPELREKVWKLYCAIEILFDRTRAVKLYENAVGTSFYKSIPPNPISPE
ncbi:MAG: serine protease [Candidatus Bathyarchaeota archaeon]|nr:serine protease [Candidatus Bathyarchaeota archaeon]